MPNVKGPDREQIETLVQTHQRELLRLCYLYLHDVQLAEDAVQETFLKAVKAWHAFRGESSEKTWLTRIAVRTCCDMRRSFWFRRVDRYVTPEMLPEIAADAEEDDQALTLAVMNLPRRLREAVILYYYQDMSVGEIAELLGVSQPGVSNRLKRARVKLKEYLEGEDEP